MNNASTQTHVSTMPNTGALGPALTAIVGNPWKNMPELNSPTWHLEYQILHLHSELSRAREMAVNLHKENEHLQAAHKTAARDEPAQGEIRGRSRDRPYQSPPRSRAWKAFFS